MKNWRVANEVKRSSPGFTAIANLRSCETISTLRLGHKNKKPWDKNKCAQINSERHSDRQFSAPVFRHLERLVASGEVSNRSRIDSLEKKQWS